MEHGTPDFGVVNSSPKLSVETTLKSKEKNGSRKQRDHLELSSEGVI